MLDLFSTEQISEAVAVSQKSSTKHAANVAKKTLFKSNLERTNKQTNVVSTTDSAKSDFIVHIAMLNAQAVHVNNLRALCELVNLKFSVFVSHCHNASYKTTNRLADFINVDTLKSDNMIVAIDQQAMIDLFLLQETQQQYQTFVVALYDFMSENTVLLASKQAYAIEADLLHEQAIVMNAEFSKKTKKATSKKKANSKK